jgi:hypothetical protein
MSRLSVDDVAEFDHYMSLPGTPTADGEATFWGGELGDDYLDIVIAYFCDGTQNPKLLSPQPQKVFCRRKTRLHSKILLVL